MNETETEIKSDAPAASEEKAPTQSSKKERTRLEKLRYNAKLISDQIAEEEAKNGVVPLIDEDDSKPLTMADLKRIDKEKAKKTALELANDIEDEDERSTVVDILENRIIPTGNPLKDLQFARAAANSEKNMQIASMQRGKTKSSGTGSGAPAKTTDRFEPTDIELQSAKFANKKTPEDIKAFILKVRKNMEAAGQ